MSGVFSGNSQDLLFVVFYYQYRVTSTRSLRFDGGRNPSGTRRRDASTRVLGTCARTHTHTADSPSQPALIDILFVLWCVSLKPVLTTVSEWRNSVRLLILRLCARRLVGHCRRTLPTIKVEAFAKKLFFRSSPNSPSFSRQNWC